jgi:hypothetical protein
MDRFGTAMRRYGAMVTVVAVAALTLLPGHAFGERAQSENLIVSLNGGVDPLELPRHRPAPVGVRLQGEIRTEDGSALPRLDQVRLELAGSGLLSTRGLPKCPGARLRNADTHQALYRCGDALIGKGSVEASIFIPEQRPFTINGKLLAFNGLAAGGRPAVWMHVFSYEPSISLAVPFVREPGIGSFRSALVASLPEWIGPYPHLAAFELILSRRFVYRGELRSYASASCPVPRPFTAGFLSFARATYGFGEEQEPISVESVRSCRARG